MTKPKRYNLSADTLAGVTEHPEGCFVHWNDYEKLQHAYNAELLANRPKGDVVRSAAEPRVAPQIEPRVFRGNGPDCLGCGKTVHEHLTNYNFCPGLPEDDKPVNRPAEPV